MSDDSDRTEAELERTRKVVREQVLAQSTANEAAVSESTGSDTGSESDWDSYTKEELAEELRSRGLPVSGDKAALVDRLNDDDAGR